MTWQDRIKEELKSVTHVVIKLGSATLTPQLQMQHSDYFDKLGEQVKQLLNARKKVIIVSSGAVALGKIIINSGKNKQPLCEPSLKEKQALASLGQAHLIERYQFAFKKYVLNTAQILLAKRDFQNVRNYNNLLNTVDQVLSWGAIPIINENDAVETRELRFGDNDAIAGYIAGMYPATLLLLLTSIDGYYQDDKKVDYLSSISREQFNQAGQAGEHGSGGMKSKILTAQRIINSGQIMNIALGTDPDIISKIVQGQAVGTWIMSEKNTKVWNARKRWNLHQTEI